MKFSLKITSSKNFILTKNEAITFNSFNNLVDEAAHALVEKGVKEDDFVGIKTYHNKNFIVLVFALWKIGAVPVPIKNNLTQNEIDKLKKKVDFKLCIDSSIVYSGSFRSIEEKEIDLQKTSLILFTSGSTSTPSAVQLTFNNLITAAENSNQVLHYNENDLWLSSLPFNHIGGFSIIFRSWLFEIPLFIPEDNKTDIIEDAFSFKPTLASLVPTQLKRMSENNIAPPDSLRCVLIGGAYSENSLIKKALENRWNIYKVYGSTETSALVTCAKISEPNIASSGKAIGDVELKIVDGEIIIKSGSVTKGYLNDDDLNNAKLKEGFYYTGDYGRIDEEGYLYIDGRKDDLIISGGENISPFELEYEILKFPGVLDCFVTKEKDAEWGEVPIAVINSVNKFTLDELSIFLKDKLAKYKLPKKIIFKEINRNEMGKIIKEKNL